MKGGHGEAVLSGLKRGGFHGNFKSLRYQGFYGSFAMEQEGFMATSCSILFKGSRGNRLELLLDALKTSLQNISS